MPEPIPMEKFRSESSKEKRLSSCAPDDWILEVFCQELLESGDDLLLTHLHLMKLRRALRERPERILTAIRNSVLPFIQSLPDIDWTIVGAEVPGDGEGGPVCNACLTRREKVRISQDDRITRDEADEQGWTCTRCGKPL